MSKNIRQQFAAASDKGDLIEQIRMAREQARELLMGSGLDNEQEMDHINALAGDFKTSGGKDEWFNYCRHLKAAYALGIAIGQLVHPNVFDAKGGTK